MEISYGQSNSCSCYENLVNNETDRDAIKKFTKFFNRNILTAVLKTHKRLKAAPNALIYNSTVSEDNRIRLKIGSRDNDPQIMKVRIQSEYRKFFYFVICDNGQADYCLTKDWQGQFDEVVSIHVFEVNHHVY
jgi:hypothetical protein